jgi:hypothetical protein
MKSADEVGEIRARAFSWLEEHAFQSAHHRPRDSRGKEDAILFTFFTAISKLNAHFKGHA